MGAGTNNGTTRKIEARVSPELADYVEGIAKLGIYGSSTAEVVRFFVSRGVESVRRERDIEKALRDRDLLANLE